MSSSERSEPVGGGAYNGAVDLAVALFREDLDSLDARHWAARLGDVERTIRKLEAVAVSIVASADRREVFRDDGHVSVRGWMKASLRISDHTVTQRARTAKLCTALPHCHDELAAGRLGVDQVREFARAFANPRCGDQLASVLNPLMKLAEATSHELFARGVRQWERLADADGAHREGDAAHAGRRARMALIGDDGWTLAWGPPSSPP